MDCPKCGEHDHTMWLVACDEDNHAVDAVFQCQSCLCLYREEGAQALKRLHAYLHSPQKPFAAKEEQSS